MYFFYGVSHGIHHHFSPPFGRICFTFCYKHFKQSQAEVKSSWIVSLDLKKYSRNMPNLIEKKTNVGQRLISSSTTFVW